MPTLVRWPHHFLDSPRGATRQYPVYLEAVGSQMSCTFPAVDQTFAIDGYSELCLCFEMIDAVSTGHGYSAFGDGPAVCDGVVVEVGVDAVFVVVVLFLVAVVGQCLIFFVGVALTDGSVVNFVFVRDVAGDAFEEGVLI